MESCRDSLGCHGEGDGLFEELSMDVAAPLPEGGFQ